MRTPKTLEWCKDDFPNWNQSCPMKTKETSETMSCLQSFLLPSQRKRIYTESSNMFTCACEDSKWNHDTRPFIAQKWTERQTEPSSECKKEQPSNWCNVEYQKNGGTLWRNALVICATCTAKWPLTSQHSRKDTVGKLTDHQSPSYIPITAKDNSIIHQFGQKMVKGLILAYALRAGRGWSGDLMTADYEDLQESEASRNLRQTIQKPKSVRKRSLRSSVRTRLREGHNWVNGRPTKIQKTTRPDGVCPEAWIQ